MSGSAGDDESPSRAHATAVICDAKTFNLRFLRAAMITLGYDDVFEARDIDELVHVARGTRADLVVFDPAMQDGAGLDAIKDLQAAVPDALLVAFCSDDAMTRTVKWDGIVTVAKRSILQLDALIAAIQAELGREPVVGPEGIPVTDVGIPVWEEVPSLVEGD
jgi:DNA-binding NarL/FixJ family response regulator